MQRLQKQAKRGAPLAPQMIPKKEISKKKEGKVLSLSGPMSFLFSEVNVLS